MLNKPSMPNAVSSHRVTAFGISSLRAEVGLCPLYPVPVAGDAILLMPERLDVAYSVEELGAETTVGINSALQ
jgi:hypothetical protein